MTVRRMTVMRFTGATTIVMGLLVGSCSGSMNESSRARTPPTSYATPEATVADSQTGEDSPLGARMQVRPLGVPEIKRGATARFTLHDGSRGWVTSLADAELIVTPAYAAGKVFVGGGFHSTMMYALDARTGRVEWSVRAPDGGPSAAIIEEDKLIFNTESCTIFAVNVNTGQVIWSRWLGDPMMGQPAAASGRVFTAHRATEVDGGHAMTALSLEDGSVLWQVPLEADIISAPVLVGDSLYFTTLQGVVYRLRQDSGQRTWSSNLAATTAPWVDGDRVFVSRRVEPPQGQEGPWEQHVVLEARSGQIVRQLQPFAARHLNGEGRGRELLTAQRGNWGAVPGGQQHLGLRNVAEGWAYQGARPTVIDGRAYLIVGDTIQCRNAETGRLLWSRMYREDRGALSVSPPAVVGSQMVVTTIDGHVYGLDIDTGMTVWAYNVGEPIVYQPSVAHGWVYLGTTHGQVIAFPVGDETLDGWHMWGGNSAHVGPEPTEPTVLAREERRQEEAELGQGTLQVINPGARRVEELPLQRTEVEAHVSGFVASVTVRQVFENSHDEPLEAAYHFPLPTQAAVDSMDVTIGARTIKGRIERRERARVIYRQARDAGLLAALLEQQRPNLFTQRVANIPPRESIVVELHYVQMLPYDDGTYEFLFPMVAGARAQDPTARRWGEDAPGIPEEEVEQHSPSVRRGDEVDVTIRIDAGVPLGDVDSPSHQIGIDRREGHLAVIELSPGDRIPNRDLVVRYDVAGRQPRGAVLAHNDERGGFFSLVLQPAEHDESRFHVRRRVTIALDTSSSMFGASMRQAQAVSRSVLTSLGPEDIFQVITFSDEVRHFAPAPLPGTTESVERAVEHIQSLRALGTTAMTAGLGAVLDQAQSSDDVLDMVVLVTDGFIASEVDLMRLVDERLGHRRLFVVGVGQAPNRFLLERLAEAGRGAALVVSPGDDPEQVASDFLTRIQRPQLTDLEVDWGGLAVSDVRPERLPDLFAGQPLLVHGRYGAPGRGIFHLQARLGGRPWSERIDVELPATTEGNEAIAPIWARETIRELMSRLYLRDDEAVVQQVTDLGLGFGLVTRFTSFIAVEEAQDIGGTEATEAPESVEDEDGPPDISEADQAIMTERSEGEDGEFADSDGDSIMDVDDMESDEAYPTEPSPTSPSDEGVYAVHRRGGCACRTTDGRSKGDTAFIWLLFVGVIVARRRLRSH